jgi:hypothetical protein
VAALAHQIARLKGPLHGSFSAESLPRAALGLALVVTPDLAGFAGCRNSRAYTGGRRYSSMRRPSQRHKRVSAPHKAVKAPFRGSRSAKIAPTCAGPAAECRRGRITPWNRP